SPDWNSRLGPPTTQAIRSRENSMKLMGCCSRVLVICSFPFADDGEMRLQRLCRVDQEYLFLVFEVPFFPLVVDQPSRPALDRSRNISLGVIVVPNSVEYLCLAHLAGRGLCRCLVRIIK